MENKIKTSVTFRYLNDGCVIVFLGLKLVISPLKIQKVQVGPLPHMKDQIKTLMENNPNTEKYLLPIRCVKDNN